MEQLLEFTNNHLWLTAGLVTSFFLLIVTEFRLKAQAVVELGPSDAVRLINASAAVIDIRPSEAFTKGHIANARNLTSDQVDGNEDRLKSLLGKMVLIACENGLRSGRVAGDLRRKGYQDVFALKGGIAAWQQDGLPLVSGKRKKDKKDKKKKGRKAEEAS